MKKIKTMEEARKYLLKNVCKEVRDITGEKWLIDIGDDEDVWTFNSDKELVEYANEQKEAIEN